MKRKKQRKQSCNNLVKRIRTEQQAGGHQRPPPSASVALLGLWLGVEDDVGGVDGWLDRQSTIVARARRMERTVQADDADVAIGREEVGDATGERPVASGEHRRRHITQRRSVHLGEDPRWLQIILSAIRGRVSNP